MSTIISHYLYIRLAPLHSGNLLNDQIPHVENVANAKSATNADSFALAYDYCGNCAARNLTEKKIDGKKLVRRKT
jgi:hypothetical protein